MVEWKKLGELGTFENIGTDKKIVEGEDIVTLLNYIDVYHHKYIDSSVPQMQVSASNKKIADCTVEKGDIFVTPSSETLDDIGHSSVITETISNAVYSYHIMRYRLFEKNMLLSYYINYSFDTDNVKRQILKKAQGLTRFGLSKDKFASILIPIPSLSEQQRIVGILDTFTASIDNLKEQIAQRRKQYEYYRDQLLDLEGKEGVEMKRLGEVCDTLSGYPFDSSQFVEEGVRLMRGMNVKRGYFEFNEELNKYWNSSEGLEKYLLKTNDIIISMDGSLVGRSFCYLREEHLPLLLVQRVARIRTKENYKFVYFNIARSFPDYVDKKKTAGAIPHISMIDINSFPIPIPSLQEQQRIVSILDTFEASIQNLEAQLAQREKQYEYYRNKLLTFE